MYIEHGAFMSGEIEEIMINYNNIPLQLSDDFRGCQTEKYKKGTRF